MSVVILLGIAIGLGMDAFAVAIATGVKLCRVSLGQVLRMSLAFGFFQAIMPLLGWIAGRLVVDKIQAWDHWIAFALLVGVGGHMAWEGFAGASEALKSSDPTRGLTLLFLAIATSIDALAVGLSFSLLSISIWFPIGLIGIVAFGMTAIGILLGCRVGLRFGKRMEIVGGLVLIAIGVKIILAG